jgi:hypothetical protein
MMRLALHIFRKDTRRLWWEITVTLGLLAALAYMDANRVGFIPGPMEGWLNLLLPAAWVYLVALVIHDEALVGDRQFWITRPYPRPALLAAKALFVLAWIQVPCFVAHAAILGARGFQPMHYLPELFGKQLVLAVALTLPAAALAAVTRNLPQFVAASLVIAAVGLFSVTRVEPLSPWMAVDQVRRAAALLVLAVFGTAIVWSQYAHRWTAASRAMGLAAILLAASLFAYLPHSYTSALGCKPSPAPADGRALSIRLSSRNQPGPAARFPRNIEQIRIPVVLSGIPEGVEAQFDQLTFEIIGPRGERWGANQERVRWDVNTVGGWLWIEHPNGEGWQSLILGRSVYDRLKGLKVSLASEVAVTMYREQKPVWMPVAAPERAVPDLGRCSSTLDEDRNDGMLDVFCESPAGIPPLVPVRLVDQANGQVWNQRLGDAMTSMAYPIRTWISPLNRHQTFFHLIDEARNEAGAQWLVPRDVLSRANVGFVPRQAAGCEIFRYQIRDVKLEDFLDKPPQLRVVH